MRYLPLGTTGLTVSAVCMGTVPFGSMRDEASCFAAMDRFAERGGNFLDTARIYADWITGAEPQASEKCIGRWLKMHHHPEGIIVATKGGHPPLTPGARPTLTERELRQQADESRQHLDLDVLPLYYLHRDDPSLPVEQIMDAVFALQDSGLICHAGCSNWTLPRILEAQAYAQRCGRPGFAVVSNRWSLARVNPQVGDPTVIITSEAQVRWHAETQLPLVPFTSLAQGYLSKVAADREIAPWLTAQYGLPENAGIAKRAAKVAADRGMTVAQVSQCFFYGQQFPVVPVIAFSTDAQMDEAIAATDMQLTAAETEYLLHG